MSGAAAGRWSTPASIVARVRRVWEQGAILSARLGGEPVLPHEIKLRQPGSSELGSRFDAVRARIAALEASPAWHRLE